MQDNLHLKNQKLLVYPTSRAIREYVNSQKEFDTLLPSIITIDELFKKSLFFDNLKLIDEEERFLFLKKAVQNIDLNQIGISSTFTHFIKQSDYIYRFFLELASEGVDIDTISTSDTYGFYSEHLQLLKQIQKNYLNILEENGAIDRLNISKFYKINEDFLDRYQSIDLVFEGYFTSFEFELIKSISKKVNLNIEFIYNKFNKKSIEKFINYGFDLELNHKYKIDFSNNKILEKTKLLSKYESLEIKGFASRINQIAFIKKSIVTLVQKGIEPSKIALILPDESFSSTISLFDKENYFNYAMGLNIYTTNLYKTIDAINLYINEDEIKNIKNLEFLGLDINEIDKLFKNNWNKNLTIEIFENIVGFFISKETNKELLEKFNESIYKLYKLFFTINEKILLKEAYKIFSQKISEISLDDINSGKITVMGLLESRNIKFDAVIICDFNESLIPKRSVKDKFLSSSIKEKSNLPTPLDRENLQKYYYERLISNSKNVIISYIKNDSEQITRFADILFDVKIDEKLYDNEYKHILFKNHSLKHFDEEVVLAIDLSKQTWSASSLKEFLECKRKYYLNHILKIKEHEISLKPKGYELGNIIHETLEEYYKHDKRGLKHLFNIFDTKRSSNLFLNLDLELWRKKLVEFISLEEDRFKDNLSVVELEKPFLCEFEGIKIRGVIDRIDKKGDNYLVIDYKTSSSLKINTKSNFDKATDFQLEFYYLAVKELFKASNIKSYYYDLYNMKLLEETMLFEKIDVLKEIFKEFKTTSVSFDKCDNNQTCQYCTYKTICNR